MPARQPSKWPRPVPLLEPEATLARQAPAHLQEPRTRAPPQVRRLLAVDFCTIRGILDSMKASASSLPLPISGTLNKQPFAKSSEAAATTAGRSFWFAGIHPPRERPRRDRHSRVLIGLLDRSSHQLREMRSAQAAHLLLEVLAMDRTKYCPCTVTMLHC